METNCQHLPHHDLFTWLMKMNNCHRQMEEQALNSSTPKPRDDHMMTYEKQMTTSNDLFFDNNHGFCKYKTCSKTFNLFYILLHHKSVFSCYFHWVYALTNDKYMKAQPKSILVLVFIATTRPLFFVLSCRVIQWKKSVCSITCNRVKLDK
jgi:hypothetical protein